MSDWDWIIGIGVPIIIGIIIYFYDDVKTPIAIFVLMNIGISIMVYAGYVNIGVLFISIILSVLLTYISIRSNSGG